MFLKTIMKLQKENKKLKEKNKDLEFENSDLRRDKLNLIGTVDDMNEEVLFLLESIEEILENNDYGNTEVKVRKALEKIREQKKEIEKELSSSTN